MHPSEHAGTIRISIAIVSLRWTQLLIFSLVLTMSFSARTDELGQFAEIAVSLYKADEQHASQLSEPEQVAIVEEFARCTVMQKVLAGFVNDNAAQTSLLDSARGWGFAGAALAERFNLQVTLLESEMEKELNRISAAFSGGLEPFAEQRRACEAYADIKKLIVNTLKHQIYQKSAEP